LNNIFTWAKLANQLDVLLIILLLAFYCQLFKGFACLGFFSMLPGVFAVPNTADFPNISFKDFSNAIHKTFGSQISLATVLVLLFTITENTDLLSLHARQQLAIYKGEKVAKVTGWIKFMARALETKLEVDVFKTLFSKKEHTYNYTNDEMLNLLGKKLDNVIKTLQLHPIDEDEFIGQLLPIKPIEPIHLICPNTAVCKQQDCKPRALLVDGSWCDVPEVNLIKNNIVYSQVYVFHAKCKKCNRIYYADHDRLSGKIPMRVFLNDAQYLKIGQSLWVDRIFSNAVLSGMYNFHASANAYATFWNEAYSDTQCNKKIITRRHVWQAFVQESIRIIAAISNRNLVLQDGLTVGEVVADAYKELGANGIILAANGHTCSECVQPYKSQAEIITDQDPAAMVGMDEGHVVPVLAVGTQREIQQASLDAQAARDYANQINNANNNDIEMDIDDGADVSMIVLDGIVMGPTVSLYF
jgi:hypothetical protein